MTTNASKSVVSVYLSGTETCPAFGLLEIVSVSRTGGKTLYNVQKPQVSGTARYLFATEVPIAPGYGRAYDARTGEPLYALFDYETDGTPEYPDTWGPEADSWLLHPGGTLFTALGGAIANTRALFERTIPSSGIPPCVIYEGSSPQSMYFQHATASQSGKTTTSSNHTIDPDASTVIPVFRDVHGDQESVGIEARFWNTDLYGSTYLDQHNFSCTKGGLFEITVVEQFRAGYAPGQHFQTTYKNWYESDSSDQSTSDDDEGDPRYDDFLEWFTDEQLASPDTHKHSFRSSFNLNGRLECRTVRVVMRVKPSGESSFENTDDPSIVLSARRIFNELQFGSVQSTAHTHTFYLPLGTGDQLQMQFRNGTISEEPRGGPIYAGDTTVCFKRIADAVPTPYQTPAET